MAHGGRLGEVSAWFGPPSVAKLASFFIAAQSAPRRHYFCDLRFAGRGVSTD